MKNRYILAILLAGLVLAAIYSHNRKQGDLIPTTATKLNSGEIDASKGESRSYKSAVEKFNAAFLTPISFYGRVVDQLGAPITEATVLASANDNPLDDHGSHRTVLSDTAGLFEIHGMHGIALGIVVSKIGYYKMETNIKLGKLGSERGFDYAPVDGEQGHHPDKANPVIFTLYKQGEIEPLTKLNSKSFDVPKDGTQVKVNIEPYDEVSSRIPREIAVRLWTNEAAKTEHGAFDWSFEVTVVNGGLTPRVNKYDFIAPEAGYTPTQKISVSGATPWQKWNERLDRSYFVKFNDDLYARLDIHAFSSSGQNVGGVELKGYLNPKAGSRNLETDPNK